MKRYNNLYEKNYSLDNLRIAHKNARRGKEYYKEVKIVDDNEQHYLELLQNMLITKTYKTSKYQIFIKNDGHKKREIYKLPYFPDRICQWAIMQIIEPILIKNFTKDTYSAIPGRGIHSLKQQLTSALRDTNIQYALKLDIRQYYPSINHTILKSKYRKLFKDENLLWLLNEIIDSTFNDTGIPIGNYLSQYSGNLYLSSFDHWIKEVKKIKYYFRYMDDIVILGVNKQQLHQIKDDIDLYFKTQLLLTIKNNWQVFPIAIRGIDYVGYRIFPNYSLLRKSICKKFKSKIREINKKKALNFRISHTDWCSINSYKGWLLWCDSYRLSMKYIAPIQDLVDDYYVNMILNKGGVL